MDQKEIQRLTLLNKYETEIFSKGYRYIAGIDEAGRGPLAGPVVAAAVILPQATMLEGLNDSKKISPKKREQLFNTIKEIALSVSVGIVSEKDIDSLNILNATKKAMLQAINGLKPTAQYLLIDAVSLEQTLIPQMSIIKGDLKSASIAAASIIAKVTRDRIIEEYAKEYPMYGFERHKGYGTREHINAIKEYGACSIHRLSFISKYVS